MTLSDLMSHKNHVQPHLFFGLDDQRRILNQLYIMPLKKEISRTKLEQSWKVSSQQDKLVQGDE